MVIAKIKVSIGCIWLFLLFPDFMSAGNISPGDGGMINPSSKSNMIVLEPRPMTLYHATPSLVHALDQYFNQQPNHFTERRNHELPTLPSDLFAAEEYDSAPFPPNDDADRITEKISQKTLDDYRALTQSARHALAKAQNLATVLDQLSGGDLLELPIALTFNPDPDQPGFSLTLVISSLKLYSRYTGLECYLIAEAPQMGSEPLIFYTPELKFNNMTGIVGDNTFGLMGDFPIDLFKDKAILTLRKADTQVEFDEGRGTFAVIGCDGLQNLSLGASVTFSRDWIKPAYTVDSPAERVTADVQFTDLQSFNSMYSEISVDPFVVNGLEDYMWEVQDFVIDMSDHISPPAIAEKAELLYSGPLDPQGNPTYYRHTFTNAGKLWKGFYLGNASVSIPRALAGDRNDVLLQANQVIFDDRGISGQAVVASQPLIEFGSSAQGGWAFGIDDMTLTVLQSSDLSVRFRGLVHVPLIADENGEIDPFRYDAIYDPLNGYKLTVGLTEQKIIPMLVAKATLHPATQIELFIQDQLRAKATIHADVSVDAQLSESLNLSIPSIQVRNLEVANYDTKLQLNTQDWDFDFTQAMDFGLFNMQLEPGQAGQIGESYSAINNQPGAALRFNAKVSLAVQENLEGIGSFSIQGNLEEVNGLEKWVHDDVVFQGFCVKADKVIPGVDSISGCLEFYTAEMSNGWGDGFRGFLSVHPSKIVSELEMIGQFGQAGEGVPFNYFMLDAMAKLERGIPIGGAVYLNGLGGGYYKNLVRPEAKMSFSQLALPDYSDLFIQNYGASMSGVQYRLKTSTEETYGFKAIAVLSTENQLSEETNTAFSGTAEYGMEFAKTREAEGNSVQRIYFQGVGKIMSNYDPNIFTDTYDDAFKLPEGRKLVDARQDLHDRFSSSRRPDKTPVEGSMVSAKFLLDASFDCPSFYGLAGVYLDAGMVYGRAAAEMYLGRNCNGGEAAAGTDWHFFIGRTTDPAEIGIDLPVIGDLARAWAYFMIGNHEMPTDVPPPTVYNALFGDGYDTRVPSSADQYEGVDYGDYRVGSGKAFATGMGLQIATPPDGLQFLFLTADLKGGMGLDMLVKQFVQSECFQNVGIDGWYGKGQSYLYAFAGINLNINLWFATIKKQILSAGVGALLKVEGPNPFHARGRLDAQLSALGVVDVKVKFKVSLGTTLAEYLSEECAAEVNAAENPIIDEVYPAAIELEDGSYPSYTDFIVDMNFEPLVVNRDGDVEFVFDLIDQDKYRTIFDQLKSQNEENKAVGAGFIEIKGPDGQLIDYTLEYLNETYASTGDSYKVRIIPQSSLPSGECTVRVPALVKAKNFPDIGPFGKDKVEDWYYGEGQNGTLYRFIISDTLVRPKITDEELIFTYPSKGMENYYPLEVTQNALVTMGMGDMDVVPGFMLALKGDYHFLLDPKNIPGGYDLKGVIVSRDGLSTMEPLQVKSFPLSTQRTLIYSPQAENLEKGKKYLFQLSYISKEEGEVNSDLGSKWVIAEISFTTSMYSSFAAKIDALSLQNVVSGGPIDLLQWSYASDENFSNEEFREDGLLDLSFNNKNRVEGRWLADNDLYWRLFQDYNDCEQGIQNGNIHPAYDIRVSGQTSGLISFASNAHQQFSKSLERAKLYTMESNHCEELPDDKSISITNDCSIFYIRGRGLALNQGKSYRLDMAKEICNNLTQQPKFTGSYNYGIRFKYRVPMLGVNNVKWMETTDKTIEVRM